MRIISKFRDYYDSAAAYGIDTTVILNRKQESISTNDKDEHDTRPDFCVDYKKTNDVKLYYDFNLLFFCGALYPAIKLTITFESDKKSIDSGWCYDVENVNEFLDSNALFISGISVYRHYKSPSNQKSWMFNKYEKIIGHFSRTDNLLPKLTEYSHEYKICYFNYNRIPSSEVGRRYSTEMQINTYPNLKELEFQRIKDSFTAFQDIDMYLSGVLSYNGNSMIETSDETKRDSHGFDKKSFKTTSPGKKHKRSKL